MKTRILLRTAKFIAFYWSIPFLLGSGFSFFMISMGEYIFADEFLHAFEQVISSCVQ